jgi:hypothetical protein
MAGRIVGIGCFDSMMKVRFQTELGARFGHALRAIMQSGEVEEARGKCRSWRQQVRFIEEQRIEVPDGEKD